MLTKDELEALKDMHDRILQTKENLRIATSADDRAVAAFEQFLFDLTQKDPGDTKNAKVA